MKDEIIVSLNETGNYNVLIPNIGYKELKEQSRMLWCLSATLPNNENLAVIADILSEAVCAIKEFRKIQEKK